MSLFEKEVGSLPLWQFKSLSTYSGSGLHHFVSGRKGGVSKGPQQSLNLSFRVGDDPTAVTANRNKIADAFGIPSACLIFPEQTHSVRIGLVTNEIFQFNDTDALITNLPGKCISVMSADCVPVLLFDPAKRVVAAVHAGWRGTVGKIAAKTVEAMATHFSCRASDIVAAIGPSISPEVYEVGNEVTEAVRQAFGIADGLLRPAGDPEKALLNLWEANRRQLIQAGVKEEKIELAGICTFQNSDLFFSARRSRNNTGRFAAGIMLG